MEEFINIKLGGSKNRKDLQKKYIDNLLVSYDFNSLYPSAQADKYSTWPAIETSYAFKKYMNNAICKLCNSDRWEELKRSAFLTVNYHNPENLIFQHIPLN